MLVAALFLPPGELPGVKFNLVYDDKPIKSEVYCGRFSGSTTIIIPPLSVIERQLCEDCHNYGIKVLVGSKVSFDTSAFYKLLHHFQSTAAS